MESKQNLDYVWRSGVAGGLAGCAAKTSVAPFDRVKILFQTNNKEFARYHGSWRGTATAIRSIYNQEGVFGLFRGHSATLARIFPYAGIKFIAYEQIRSVMIQRKDQETATRRVLSGALAGIFSVLFTYPLEIIRVRMAFETQSPQARNGMLGIVKKIYNEPLAPLVRSTAALHTASPSDAAAGISPHIRHLSTAVTAPAGGLKNFYRGFLPTLYGMVPYAGMSFLTHDYMNDILRLPSFAPYTTLPKPEDHPENKPAPLRTWAHLSTGGVAGLVAQTVSYPVEVVRRRMQVGGAVGDGHRLRILETINLVFKEKGFRGFYVGLTIGYLKVVPMVSISFFTYERFKDMLGI